MLDTNSGKFGRDADNLDPMQFRNMEDPMGAVNPRYSGDLVIEPELGWDREGYLVFRQDKPLPFNILSMTVLGQTGDT